MPTRRKSLILAWLLSSLAAVSIAQTPTGSQTLVNWYQGSPRVLYWQTGVDNNTPFDWYLYDVINGVKEFNCAAGVCTVPTLLATTSLQGPYNAAQLVGGPVPNGVMPSTLVTYNSGAGYSLGSGDTGNIIQESAASGACPFTLPVINTNGITPGGYQTLIYSTDATTCSVTPTSPTTINGGTLVYMGQGGWYLITADSNSSAFNYVALVGGGYVFNQNGTAAWFNNVKAPGFVVANGTGSFVAGSAGIAGTSVNDTIGYYTNNTLVGHNNVGGAFQADFGAPTITSTSGNCTMGTQTGTGWKSGFFTFTYNSGASCTFAFTFSGSGVTANTATSGWHVWGAEQPDGKLLFQIDTTPHPQYATAVFNALSTTGANAQTAWWSIDPS